MTLRGRLFAIWSKKRPKSLSTMKIIAITFAVIVLLGAGLLTLPAASRSGISCGFLPALFTATSATCVTGLSLFDTYTQWSGFGQIVIISLIQIGGLGVITIGLAVMRASGMKIGLWHRSTMQSSIAAPHVGGMVRLTGFIFKMTVFIEVIGTVLLCPVFCSFLIIQAGMQ